MSITRELDNLKKIESVGFSHEQAETLADVIEKSHVDSQESLKEFIHNENTKLENKLSNKISSLDSKLSKEISSIHVEISSLHVEISKELKDLLIKIFGIIVGTVGIAVTILKLFP